MNPSTNPEVVHLFLVTARAQLRLRPSLSRCSLTRSSPLHLMHNKHGTHSRWHNPKSPKHAHSKGKLDNNNFARSPKQRLDVTDTVPISTRRISLGSAQGTSLCKECVCSETDAPCFVTLSFTEPCQATSAKVAPARTRTSSLSEPTLPESVLRGQQ